MKFHPLFLAAALSLPLSAARASNEEGKPPGFFGRTLQTLHLAPRTAKDSSVRVKNATLDLQLSPLPFKLSENRQIKVMLALTNHTRKYVHLEFPTTQRFEIIIRDTHAKVLTQWSENQSFTNDPAHVTVDPGERLEYNASLSTRDLVEGQQYIVEAFFPNFSDLRIQKSFVPLK